MSQQCDCSPRRNRKRIDLEVSIWLVAFLKEKTVQKSIVLSQYTFDKLFRLKKSSQKSKRQNSGQREKWASKILKLLNVYLNALNISPLDCNSVINDRVISPVIEPSFKGGKQETSKKLFCRFQDSTGVRKCNWLMQLAGFCYLCNSCNLGNLVNFSLNY